MSKRLTKRQAKRQGFSFFGKVNAHLLDNEPISRTVHADGSIVTTYFGGLVSRFSPVGGRS